jgi:hypothetical protein
MRPNYCVRCPIGITVKDNGAANATFVITVIITGIITAFKESKPNVCVSFWRAAPSRCNRTRSGKSYG